jgi:hypothetical protein
MNRRFGDFTGHLDRYKGVEFINDDARSYLERSRNTFDIIQISVIDTWAATSAGAFALTENALYTLEGWLCFLERLEPMGHPDCYDQRAVTTMCHLSILWNEEPWVAASALTCHQFYFFAEAAKRYDEALAACERGLAHVDGPIGRTGLLLTKARALLGKREAGRARETLELPLRSARTIGNKRTQENNVRRISALMAELARR